MQEYLDVYYEDGSSQNKSVLRGDVHKQGLWHKSVHVWIVNSKGELLSQRRCISKESYAGMWDASSAGHISAGETPQEAALKEVGEELGLVITVDDLEYITTVKTEAVLHNGAFVNKEFVELYLVQRDVDLASLVLQESEVSDVHWIPFPLLEELHRSADPRLVPIPAGSEEYFKLYDVLRSRFSVMSNDSRDTSLLD